MTSNNKKIQTKTKAKRNRITFTSVQLKKLEREFKKSRYISKEKRSLLAGELNLSDENIKVWFQNRRVKCKIDHENEVTSNENHEISNDDLESLNQAHYDDKSPITHHCDDQLNTGPQQQYYIPNVSYPENPSMIQPLVPEYQFQNEIEAFNYNNTMTSEEENANLYDGSDYFFPQNNYQNQQQQQPQEQQQWYHLLYELAQHDLL